MRQISTLYSLSSTFCFQRKSMKADYHIHTVHLGCANETMTIPAIIESHETRGVTSLGFADHFDNPEKFALHRKIKEDMQNIETDIEMFFGCEIGFLECDGDFALTPELKAEYGFDYAIGSVHRIYTEKYDPEHIVAIQHRHHLLACEKPLVDVLGHPYWFWKGGFTQNGWEVIDAMDFIPESYGHELGKKARETGTAIELNGTGKLNTAPSKVDKYLRYFEAIVSEGAMISFGSDAHNTGHLQYIELCWEAGKKLGLKEDQIWTPHRAKSK